MQIGTVRKRYRRLDKVYGFDNNEKVKAIYKEGKGDDKALTFKKYNKSSLICHSQHSFYKYDNIKKFNCLSFKSKYSFLINFYYNFDKFSRLDPEK